MPEKLQDFPEISQAFQDFCDYLQIERNYSPLTIDVYRQCLKDFFLFVSASSEAQHRLNINGLNAITRFDVKGWLASDSKLKRITLKKKLSALRSFFAFACKKGLVKDNVTRNISIQIKEKRIIEAIPKSEIQAVMDNMQHQKLLDAFTCNRNWAMLELFYGCGIRRAELITLNDNDIDWPKNYIRVIGKGNKERWIPFGETVRVALQSYLKERPEKAKPSNAENPFFITDTGNRVYPMLVHRVVKLAFADLPLQFPNNPHAIRHAYATHLIQNGADLHSVQKLMGHQTILSTEVYVHNELKHLKAMHEKALPRG
jgi:integrase/recombinase XerC